MSQFDLVSWTLTNKDGQSAGLPSNHRNLRINESEDKGAGILALLNSQVIFRFRPTSCERSKIYDSEPLQSSEVERALVDLESNYRAGNSQDSVLLRRFNTLFRANIDEPTFKAAFAANTFGELLYQLVFDSGCTTYIQTQKKPQINVFPKIGQRMDNVERWRLIKAHFTEAGTAQPILLGGVCAYRDNGVNTCLRHAVVISGYKVMCKSGASSAAPDCRELLRVHNCWGTAWQNETDGGWVDAIKLVHNVSVERNDGGISWLSASE